MSRDLGDVEKERLTEETAKIIQEFVEETHRNKEDRLEVKELRKKLDESEAKIEKLLRTVRYWREQTRRKH